MMTSTKITMQTKDHSDMIILLDGQHAGTPNVETYALYLELKHGERHFYGSSVTFSVDQVLMQRFSEAAFKLGTNYSI